MMLIDRVDREDDREQHEGLAEDVLGVAEVDAEDLDPVERRGRRS